jgi:uncharacterized protein
MARPPRLGKVKTRLAETLGAEKALAVYRRLLDHTFKVVRESHLGAKVFWSEEDKEAVRGYRLLSGIQKGNDLGERMADAFLRTNKSRHIFMIMIGTDCFELRESLLHDAVESLNTHQVVIGPSEDGGYYLLATRGYYPELLANKSWSSPRLLEETIGQLEDLQISYHLLETLNDIDTLDDLKSSALWTEMADIH